MRGNAISIAVGIIIGIAFGAIINSSIIDIKAIRCPNCTSELRK